MWNKICDWLETGLANLRSDGPAAENSDGHRVPGDGQIRRKRPIECLEDGHNVDRGLLIKKSRMGDLIDTVKIAAEGVKTQSSIVATWMKNNVSPTLRSIVPGTVEPPPGEPQPSTSADAAWDERLLEERNSLDQTFAAPSTNFAWKTTKSVPECFRNEKSLMGSKVCRRQVCMSSTHRDVPKTNGHSFSILPPSITTELLPTPRLGRPRNLRPHGTSSFGGVSRSSCTSMYEKTFPIKVVQSPTHSVSSGRVYKKRPRCTAEESVQEEEKEVYRQLLTMVSAGQSSFLRNGSSHAIVRSHRDFTSFLTTSHRLLQFASPTGSAAGGTSEAPSSPPSPRGISSLSSSNLPSPVGATNRPSTQTWSLDTDLSSSRAATLTSTPSPSALQDNSSQDTQSSAHDGDSVIIVNEQKGKKQDSSSVSCFQAELWIKELTSMYDSRARERRRQIEEQELLAAQLLRQRLSAEGQRSPDVEVHVRVPLEREVPLVIVAEEPKALEEKPEFPELTEEMEAAVNKVLRGGNSHEVLSEGFGLSLTRKDLQTLSNLNWLNDEVINFYMNLLVERSKEADLPSVNTFSTFFYPKLRSSGYSAVRRWTKKMDIFAKDILLVPVHLGVHWCLSVVDFRKKSIQYFDSMGGNNDEACRALFEYLKSESKDKKGKELDTSGWTLHSNRPNEIPQQMNGSDCGMFTCKYAEYITKDKKITFTQDRHVKICQKSAAKRRKVFDSSRQRAEGTDIPVLKPIKPKSQSSSATEKAEPPKKPSNWRKKHEDFIATIRAAKQVTQVMKEGGPLPPPPPPTYDPDYVQCPYCQRRFNENAADRHIKFCQEQAARMPNKGKLGEVKKAPARSQYKPPAVKKSNSPAVSTIPSASSRLPQRSGLGQPSGIPSGKSSSAGSVRSNPSGLTSPPSGVGNKTRVTSSGYGPARSGVGLNKKKVDSYISRNDVDGVNEVGNGATKSKFCHACGTKYPVESAKFCCECGVRRMCI